MKTIIQICSNYHYHYHFLLSFGILVKSLTVLADCDNISFLLFNLILTKLTAPYSLTPAIISRTFIESTSHLP
jgi:hypothetical protein